MIDITMTATRRPELLEVTLGSFKEKLFKNYPARVIINVDPVGHDIDSFKVVDKVREFFPHVLARCPKIAHFGNAFKWTWGESRSDFIFHLEEDWKLLKEVDLQDMFEVMKKYPRLAILRLPYAPCGETNKNWSHFVPWNGDFYEIPVGLKGLLGFAGHPSLIRRVFVKIGYSMIDETRNPEKQLKWREGHRLMNLEYGLYGKPGEGPAVEDIGKRWKLEHGWAKKDDKSNFTVWEKSPIV